MVMMLFAEPSFLGSHFSVSLLVTQFRLLKAATIYTNTCVIP